jgi:hypothetical protein
MNHLPSCVHGDTSSSDLVGYSILLVSDEELSLKVTRCTLAPSSLHFSPWQRTCLITPRQLCKGTRRWSEIRMSWLCIHRDGSSHTLVVTRLLQWEVRVETRASVECTCYSNLFFVILHSRRWLLIGDMDLLLLITLQMSSYSETFFV